MRKKTGREFDDTKGILRSLSGLAEVVVLTLLYYAVWRICYDEEGFPFYFGRGKYVLMGVYALLTVLFFQNFDGFLFGRLRKTDMALSQCIAVLLVNFITYWQLCLIANKMINPVPMLVLCAADVVVSLVFIIACTGLYHQLYAPHNMVMIYGSDSAVELKIKMDSRPDKYEVSHMISVEEGYEKICAEIVKYDTVLINDVPAQIRNDILKFCYKNQIRAYVAPKISDIILRGAKEINLFDTPLLLVKGSGLSPAQRVIKRAMDIVLCLIAMVIALPIMLVVAAAIKLEDGGPVFYKQKRVTKDGKVFDIIKFRSMIVDAEKDGRSIPATERDPRITKVGRVIRATRIDELPQILNILKGDMSIVGPRPERVEHVEKYTQEIPEFPYRLKVKGGLTGYAQIYGKYNTGAYDKLRLDLLYIENYSVLLDIKLIVLTLRVMFQKDSTEGFDKAKALEKQSSELLKQRNEAQSEEEKNTLAGVGK